MKSIALSHWTLVIDIIALDAGDSDSFFPDVIKGEC